MQARIRQAASVLLVRSAGGASRAGEPPRAPVEVFLVERSPALRYFGGYHALPGGTLEANDEGLAANAGGDPARWAALRELFEETGVLAGVVAGTPPPPAELDTARRRLAAGTTSFASLLAEWSLRLDPGVLAPLCAITTPPFAPVRFATQFFWLSLPASATPSVIEGELVGGHFVDPTVALGAWRHGRLALAPPILMLFAELAALPPGTPLSELAVRAAAIDGQAYGSPGRRIYFSPGVQILPLPTRTKPPATHTNTLLVGGERLWIVDPSSPEAAAQGLLWGAVDGLLAEGAELAGVLLTHHHPDHVGALEAVLGRYAVAVGAHPRTLEALGVPPARQRALVDGDRLPLGSAPDGSTNWTLEVLHTPGHAPGHLAFRDSRYGALLAGDLVSTLSTVVIDPPEGHLATYLGSLSRLLALPGELGVLYPGHGPAVRNAREVVRRTLAHREERLAKVASALGSEPVEVAALLARVYDDVEPALWPLAERSLLASLEWLCEQGRAEQVAAGWQVRSRAGSPRVAASGVESLQSSGDEGDV
jgi:ribonuclease/clavin/mitogillin